MAGIFQPVGQVRFTNVAFVKYKKGGKRFEVTAYRNKVVNWRNKVETDIDEVLQAPYVFSNASKGITAKAKDLKAAFGTDDHLECCKIVLEKGELQVSDKERQVQLDSMFREVATIIADKCVNPTTSMPHPVSVIEAALREAHFSVNPKVSTKRQALEAIPTLKPLLPIERAHMHFKAVLPPPAGPAFLGLLPDHAVVLRDVEVQVDKTSGLPWSAALAAHAVAEADAPAARRPGRAVEFSAEPELLRRLRTWCSALDAAALSAIMAGEEPALPQTASADAGASGGKKRSKKQRRKAAAAAAAAEASTPSSSPGPVSASAEAAWFPASIDVLAMSVGTPGADATATTALGDRDIMSLGSSTAAAAHATAVPSSSPAGLAEAVQAEGGRVAMPSASTAPKPVVSGGSGALACRKCGGAVFEERAEYRAHFRSTWHTLNLKRAMQGMPPVLQQDFAALGEDRVAELLEEATPK